MQNRKLPGGRPEKNYQDLLQKKFTSLVGTPKWAEIKDPDDDDESDSDNEILKHSTHLAQTKQTNLPKEIIDIKALKEINSATHIEGNLLTSLQFHPTSTVAFVAGLKGVLSVFQVITENIFIKYFAISYAFMSIVILLLFYRLMAVKTLNYRP